MKTIKELEAEIKFMKSNFKIITKGCEDYVKGKKPKEDFMDNYRRYEQLEILKLEIAKSEAELKQTKDVLGLIDEMLKEELHPLQRFNYMLNGEELKKRITG